MGSQGVFGPSQWNTHSFSAFCPWVVWANRSWLIWPNFFHHTVFRELHYCAGGNLRVWNEDSVTAALSGIQSALPIKDSPAYIGNICHSSTAGENKRKLSVWVWFSLSLVHWFTCSCVHSLTMQKKSILPADTAVRSRPRCTSAHLCVLVIVWMLVNPGAFAVWKWELLMAQQDHYSKATFWFPKPLMSCHFASTSFLSLP